MLVLLLVLALIVPPQVIARRKRAVPQRYASTSKSEKPRVKKSLIDKDKRDAATVKLQAEVQPDGTIVAPKVRVRCIRSTLQHS